MKIYMLIIAIILFLVEKMEAQGNTIVFDYDKNGKMLQRKIKVFPIINLPNPSLEKDSLKKEAPLTFNVFPNPANTFINVDGPLPEGEANAKINILSLNGQILKNELYYGKQLTINIEGFANGAYLIEILYSKIKRSVYKIIISN